MKIKELPIQIRPREKAMIQGIETLSNHELLMLVLRHGNSRQSVSEIAENLLVMTNQLETLYDMKLKDLMRVSGIKKAKALELCAILELGKRMHKASLNSQNLMQNPSSIASWCQREIGYLKQECFLVVYLSAAGKMISYEILFKGTLDKSLVHPREIFLGAIKANASSLIAVHNHPAGSLIPSEMDIIVTKKLLEISQIVQIPFLDHLIVTQSSFVSIIAFMNKKDMK